MEEVIVVRSDTVRLALAILLAAALLNAAIFTVFQIMIDKSMRCVQYQGPRPNRPINYLIAGNVAQPEQAFEFLLGDLEGETIFCNYRQYGWSIQESANEILSDIWTRTKDLPERAFVRIYAVSCGDIVARHLEDMCTMLPFADVEVVAINPASNPQLLKPYAKWGLRIVTPIMKVFCHAIGFLSCIPCIPSTGSWHSLTLLTDQWLAIAYSDAPHKTDLTTGAIISSQDEFLVNEKVREYFSGVRIIEVNAGHADVQNHPIEFADACQLATEANNRQQTAEKVETR